MPLFPVEPGRVTGGENPMGTCLWKNRIPRQGTCPQSRMEFRAKGRVPKVACPKVAKDVSPR